MLEVNIDCLIGQEGQLAAAGDPRHSFPIQVFNSSLNDKWEMGNDIWEMPSLFPGTKSLVARLAVVISFLHGSTTYSPTSKFALQILQPV